MKPKRSQRGTILRGISILLFAALACSPFQPGALSSPTPQPSAPATVTPEAGAAATTAPLPGTPAAATPPPDDQAAKDNQTFEAEVAFGPGAFSFPDPGAGLADLSSYKATLTLSFEGTNAGQPHSWSKTYIMLAAQAPAARQLTIEKTGGLSDLNPVFMAEMDGADYERRGDNDCIANAITDGYSLGERMEPSGFFPGIIGAEAAGSDPVNGVAASHYTFDERAIGQLAIAQSTGELWVATEGGYALKYVLRTTGNADFFGEGIEGTLNWNYQLTDINQPLAIELPQDCPAGMVTAPQLPDAAAVVNVPGLLSYSTASSRDEATAFYQQALPALGWQAAAEPVLAENAAWQIFTQGRQQLSVIITTGEANTTVSLVLENK